MAAKRGGKRKVRVAAQLYTVRDFLKTPADMRKTFKTLNRIGYESAQISGVGPIAAADLRAMMMDCGIEPMGAHVGLDAFRQDLAGVVRDCNDWGIEYVAIPWLSADTATTPDGWRKLGREFASLGKQLAAEGLVLQYHNHAFEFQKYGIKSGKGGKTGLEYLYEAADPRYLQAELDFGWVTRANQNPVAWAKRMQGRLDQVHLKDWGIHKNEPVWRAVGEGGIDWPPVLAACKASGTVDYIVEQDSCPITGDPFRSLLVSLENLRAMKLA